MRSWSRSSWALVAVALVGLVIGVLLGGRTELLERVGVSGQDPTAPVSAGAINVVRDKTSAGAHFELPVLNTTDKLVDVTILGVPGLASPLKSKTAHDVPPGVWRAVEFSATANCDQRPPRKLSAVRLRVGAPGERSETVAPLPDRGRVLLDYQQSLCATSSQPLPQGFLEGVWIVEQVYGGDQGSVGAQLMRFEPNGNFTSDAEGSLFSGEPGVWGTYRADGELLTITVKGGYGCAAGTRAVWRINLMPDERLSMVLVRGTCPAGSHLIWVARRVQHDVGLPTRPPGVAPTGPMAMVRADDAAVCFGEGKPITGLPSGFPADFYFPDRTEIVAAEDQGAEGVHVIGITPLEYNLVLHELLGAASPGGWKVTSSSIGSGHAEAAWAGHGYRGRWAIRESDRCPSQVVLEVLARKR